MRCGGEIGGEAGTAGKEPELPHAASVTSVCFLNCEDEVVLRSLKTDM